MRPFTLKEISQHLSSFSFERNKRISYLKHSGESFIIGIVTQYFVMSFITSSHN